MKSGVTISRRSWHYKLHCFVFTFFNWERPGCGPINAYKALFRKKSLWQHSPVTICGYFWSTLFLSMLAPLFTVLLAALGILAAPVLGTVFGAFWLHDKYRSFKPRPKGAPPGRIERATGFAFDYVVATKQKHCPLIDLTD